MSTKQAVPLVLLSLGAPLTAELMMSHQKAIQETSLQMLG